MWKMLLHLHINQNPMVMILPVFHCCHCPIDNHNIWLETMCDTPPSHSPWPRHRQIDLSIMQASAQHSPSVYTLLVYLCWCFMSQSTIFQSCQDSFLSSRMEPVLSSWWCVLIKNTTQGLMSLDQANLRFSLTLDTNWATVLCWHIADCPIDED